MTTKFTIISYLFINRGSLNVVRANFAIVSAWIVLMASSIPCNSQERSSREKPLTRRALILDQQLGFSRKVDPNSEAIWQGDADDFYTQDWQLATCRAIATRESDKLLGIINSNEFEINSLGRGNMSFLYWAYLQGNLEAFEILLQNGASPDIALTTELNMLPGPTRTTNQSVLLHAYHNSQKRPGFFEAGIGYTKKPSQRFPDDSTFAHYCVAHGMTAVQLSLLIKIIATGVDLDAKNDRGETACHIAAKHNPDSLLLLILAGADPKIPFPDGRQLSDEVRQRCDPTDNPLSAHYQVVDYWIELLLAPPKFHKL